MKSVAFDETYSPTAKSHNSNPEVCDEKIAAGKFWLNGLYYFVNARYDFHAKIWISPGLQFSQKIFRANFVSEQPRKSPNENGVEREIPKLHWHSQYTTIGQEYPIMRNYLAVKIERPRKFMTMAVHDGPFR